MTIPEAPDETAWSTTRMRSAAADDAVDTRLDQAIDAV
jgi:hypothetical protein